MPWTVHGPVASIFWALKKQAAAKRFATDADMKQAVTYWLESLDTEFFYAGIVTFDDMVE
jgi:hypothetical protein